MPEEKAGGAWHQCKINLEPTLHLEARAQLKEQSVQSMSCTATRVRRAPMPQSLRMRFVTPHGLPSPVSASQRSFILASASIWKVAWLEKSAVPPRDASRLRISSIIWVTLLRTPPKVLGLFAGAAAAPPPPSLTAAGGLPKPAFFTPDALAAWACGSRLKDPRSKQR